MSQAAGVLTIVFAIDFVSSTVIGIDLGTTYSCVAVFRNGRSEVIANTDGSRVTPSVVAFTESDVLVGFHAKNQAALNPTNTVYDVKRLIGRSFDDPITQQDMKLWPFKVINENNNPVIQVTFKNEKKTFIPQQISAMVLQQLKQSAEEYLNEKVTDAVITVPAYFNDAQRQATKDAGRIAGLNVLRIINEPTAAALTFIHDRPTPNQRYLLIYDLGGGTFDVSLVSVKGLDMTVLATAGDTHLGGEDFDNRLMEHMLDIFKQKYGLDARNNKKAIQKLRKQAETAKIFLSGATSAPFMIDAFHDGIDLDVRGFKRQRFEEINNDAFLLTLNPVRDVLEKAKLTVNDIDEVIFAGGSTRIPKIREIVSNFFGGKEPNKGVNPDESIAMGAAIQGAILSGEIHNVSLQDVVPRSLGIEVAGGAMGVFVEAFSQIPIKVAKKLTTSFDDQTVVILTVLEGDSKIAAENHVLGTFKLSGIPPRSRGQVKIDVTFEVDEHSILQVFAVDLISGSNIQVQISGHSRITPSQLEQLIAIHKELFSTSKKGKR
eukprot:c7824_g1_i3.p1 GENE.c7824_g1_i3~~c7824_g1_i3.p1  ORF type:complete len:546 (+),score=152.70 c7824_g1_i3:38-1675(+)